MNSLRQKILDLLDKKQAVGGARVGGHHRAIQHDRYRIYFALHQVKKDLNRSPLHGICGHLNEVLAQKYDAKVCERLEEALMMMFRQWPGVHRTAIGTPDMYYPVGGFVQYRNEMTLGTVWDNPRREELLDWLLEQLAKEI